MCLGSIDFSPNEKYSYLLILEVNVQLYKN